VSHYIVDAGVAAKWFLPEDYTPEAQGLLKIGERFSAPDFLQLEMDNLLCKRIRRGEISEKDANDARAMLAEIFIQYHSSLSLRERSYKLALLTRQSVYDCLYLALALKLNAQLVTADRRLYQKIAVGPLADYVEWVGKIGK